MLAGVGAACGEDSSQAPIIKINDHFVCVDGDTDVPSVESVPFPLGRSDSADETGADESMVSMKIERSVAARLVDYGKDKVLLDGDVAISREHLPRHLASLLDPDGNNGMSRGFRSTVGCEPFGRRDDIWDRARLGALTYCLGEFQDAEVESAIRTSVLLSTWEYELAADVNFVHLAELDGQACNRDADVVFTIRQGVDPEDCGPFGCPLAIAFFPSEADDGAAQEVLFFSSSVDNPEYSTKGIVQHELGHVLGLWHEHARFVQDDDVLTIDEAFACSLSSGATANWRGLTPPDDSSIMGYPYCRGTSGGAIGLSAFDRLALRYLYNLPSLTRRSFDAGPTADILWYGPEKERLSTWYGAAAGEGIDFTEVEYCADGAPGPECLSLAPRDWKPIGFASGESASVLMFGPGEVVDRVFESGSLPAPPKSSEVAIGLRTAVPYVGDLMESVGMEDVLLALPGPGDDWGLAASMSSFDSYDGIDATDGFFDVAVGSFVFRDGSLGDQLLWYSENEPTWRLVFRTASGVFEEFISPESCGLGGLSALNAIVGNFDDDDFLEILWYAAQEGSAILWSSIDDCATSQQSFPIDDRPKPHPGDFDGDGYMDVIWDKYQESDEIWLFDDLVPLVIDVDVPEDALPIVGDFDGDGCSDVLWYYSHLTTGALWHSMCNGTFVSSVLETPSGVAPVGYSYGHGRAFRGGP